MGLMDKFSDPSLFDTLSMGDKVAGSFVTMIMGMGITFCILVLLWAFVSIMGKVMKAAERKPKAAEPAAAAPAPASASAETVTSASPSESDDVTAAVIAAAIAAYRGSGGTGDLVVRKITRVSGGSTPWSGAAIDDCIESRRF